MKAFLDTHAAVAMYQGDPDAFGAAALDLIERAALFYSPIVRLELTFLHEIDRITVGADELLGALNADYGVAPSRDDIGDVVSASLALSWTRDPFDRLIVATAQLHRAPLITKDERIRAHYRDAIW